jgi:CRP/FNR family transcriptional regulator, cyclic AMP receptor protein
VMEPHVYPASAWTTEPAKLLVVDGKGLRELCEGSKRVGYVVFRAIGEVMSARLGQAVRGRGVHELHRFKILRGLDLRELDAITQISHFQEFQKGDLLTTEGALADQLYLFLKGGADVRVRDADGCQVQVDEIGPGDVLGWSAVMDPCIYTASAWALGPSEAMVVSGPQLRELMAADTRLGYEMTKGVGEVISRRFGRAVGVRGDLRAKDAPA